MNAHHIEHIKLAVINDGNGSECGTDYKVRCHTARLSQDGQAKLWLRMVDTAAGRWQPDMSATDRLRCAIELAEYYAEHVKEVDESA